MPQVANNEPFSRPPNVESAVMWILPSAMLMVGIVNVPLALTSSVGEPFRAWAYFGSSFGCLLAVAMLVGDAFIRRSPNLQYVHRVLRQCVTGGLILICWLIFLNFRAGMLLTNSNSLKNSVEFSLLTLTSILGFTWWNLMLRIRHGQRREMARSH